MRRTICRLRRIVCCNNEIRPASDMADILFEQLGYLIRFADQEHGRLERVKAVLMEPFE